MTNLLPIKNRFSIELGRIDDIDKAKGLAIMLVVFGHIVSRQPPNDNLWYEFAKAGLYSFHMAFFMFLSGVVFFARLSFIENWSEYRIAIKKRFLRLMPAYFLFAGVVFFGKLIAQNFAHVDNPVSGIYDLVNIVLFPMQSISSFLWYIYALFVISVITLGIVSLTKGSLSVLLIVGTVALFVPQVDFLAIGQITKYIFFFIIGGFAISKWNNYISIVDKIWLPAALLMIFLISKGFYTGEKWIVIALLSLPALHGVCRQNVPGTNFLLYVGAMTFPIYLMNTMAIGFVKAIMLKLFNWDGANFFVFLPVLFISGIVIPVLIKKYIFSHIAWLNRIT